MEISGGITFSGGWTIETPIFNTIFKVSGWGQEITNTGTIIGPAPLAVFFDASETTAYQYNAFREAGYHFDFGYATPTTPGTWTYNGEPKGNQIGGPTAAHVYETPGTYIASLRAQLPNGLYQDKFVTIIVQDPNVVYAGTATVCISLAGNFTGAPAGAVTQTTVPTTAQPNTRYLFRCGEDYSAVTMAISYKTLPADNFNLQIGSFGTGTRPKITKTFPNRPYSSSQCQLSNVTIFNCSLNQCDLFFGDYLTIHNSDVYTLAVDGQAPFMINTTVEQWMTPGSTPNYANSRWSRNIFISENTCDAALGWNVFGACKNMIILGNNLYQTPPFVSHCIRTQMYKGFIGHNYLRPGGYATLYLKLYQKGTNPNYDWNSSPYGQEKWMCNYVVVADNWTQPDGVCQTFFQISPEASTFYGFVQNYILERNILNKVAGGTGGITGIGFGGMNLTGRTNTFNNFTSTSNWYGVDTHTGGSGGVPQSITGPYYLPAGMPEIDNIKTFATPSPGIYPAKADYVTTVFTASGWGQTASAGGTITGPAPLYIFFDCDGTTSSKVDSGKEFGELGYYFDFGYSSSPGTWPLSGKDKGKEIGGPLAAHVYETPGTYIAKVRAQDAFGAYTDKSITIVVSDPNTYWSAGQGRTQVTISPSAGTWPVWADDTRYILQAGGNYTSFGDIQINETDRIFIDGGTGTKPIISGLIIETVSGTTVRNWSQCGIYKNLSSPIGSFLAELPSAYQLVLDSNFGRFNHATSLIGKYNTATNQTGWYFPKYHCIQNCLFTANNGSSTGYLAAGWWDMMSRFSILGVEAHCENGGTHTEHTIRSMGSYKVFIAHSYFHTPGTLNGPKHFLAIRAMGYDAFTETLTGATYSDTKRAEQVIVQSCTFGKSTDTAHTWPFQFGYRYSSGATPEASKYQILKYGRTQDCTWVVTSDLPSDGLEMIGNYIWDLNTYVWRGSGYDPGDGSAYFKPIYSNNAGTPDNNFLFSAPPLVIPQKP